MATRIIFPSRDEFLPFHSDEASVGLNGLTIPREGLSMTHFTRSFHQPASNLRSHNTGGILDRIYALIAVTTLVSGTLYPTPANAKDHVLVIGGGPTADHSEISIERNVGFFRETSSHLDFGTDNTTVLFASGSSRLPDVCLKHIVPEANLVMGLLSDKTRGLDLTFRHHALPNVAGASTRSQVLRELSRLGNTLTPNDRCLIYVTAHGGKSKEPAQGVIHLWGSEKITVRDVAVALKRWNAKVPVVFVMVQCYSGSFAHLLFNEGDRNMGLTDRPIATFLATTRDRPAAGCTPDTKQENYHEYSTYFWAALGGMDRLGYRTKRPDINGDGLVDASEAHAYVIVNSDTIDIPQKTSDLFLSEFSPTGNDAVKAEWLSFEELIDMAFPIEKWTLNGLSRELAVSGSTPIRTAKQRADRIKRQRSSNSKAIKKLEKSNRDRAKKMMSRVAKHWPFLKNPWQPDSMDLVNNRSEEFLQAVKTGSDYDALMAGRSELKALKAEDLSLEKKWAKLQRYIHLAEVVARRNNLMLAGSQENVEYFQRLVQLESSFPRSKPTGSIIPVAN